MITRQPYEVLTVKDAEKEGYFQIAAYHLPGPQHFFDIVQRIQKKIEWLNKLTWKERMYEIESSRYDFILYYSFIIVDQENHGEYIKRSSGYRFCFWAKYRICDN